MKVTGEEIAEWRRHPVTKEVFNYFKSVITNTGQAMTQGRTLDCSSADQTLGNTAFEVGRIAGIKEVINFDADSDIEE